MMGGRMTDNDLKEPKMSRPLLLQSRPQSRTGSSIPARSAKDGRQDGCDNWMAATAQEEADGGRHG